MTKSSSKNKTASVFLLQHSHKLEGGEEEVKVLGIFQTRQHGFQAIERFRKLPGFRDYPDGYHLEEYPLNKLQWTSGFIEKDGLDLPEWFCTEEPPD
ncbi:MAG: hypothetical protein DWQ01_07650 [Planctomycetota bacterium]|nr:MAG: hypothetical protein DWQ01_07650 [Planctomycetota bacterium]